MKFKHCLPEHLIEKTAWLEQFANGGTQVCMKLKDGRIFKEVLISTSKWVIAMRGYKELHFDPSDIEDVFQNEEDKNPQQHGGWEFWDKCK